MASSATGSSSTDLFLSRRFLCDKMIESGKTKVQDQVNYLKTYLENRTNCPLNKVSILRKKISYFVTDFKKKWAQACRIKDRFLARNAIWLDSSIGFPTYVEKSAVGSPKTNFVGASERTKRMKTHDLRSQYSPDELSYAAQMSLRSSGLVDASKLVKEVTTTSPQRATRYRVALEKLKTGTRVELSPEEALSMFVDAKLTRSQYNIVRGKDKERFPSYKIIQMAKKDCYPGKDHIVVTDVVAEVKLQGLLNHTALRLMQLQREVISSQENLQRVHLITKWGFDGSSGHSEYKQKFSSGPASDESIFLSSLVPLKLISGDPDESAEHQVVIWNNRRPSSTRYCRPIRFQFAHETTDLEKKERDYIESQINNLVPSLYDDGDGRIIEIHHKLLFTMVDGKICNSLTNTTSTMKCYLCGLTSKDFNDIDKCIKANITEGRVEFGLSILHAWIRFFECILHVGYKLPLKKWQARGVENKQVVENVKKNIKAQFKSQLGLIVDKPKPGYGNSNDGNTARRFFENAEISSTITGVDIEIIKRFRTILKTLACGHNINKLLFKAYTLETAQLFVDKYSWYPMPPTVHKVLIHGPTIIEKALLPIGQLSEEAQEANNKEFKNYRERFSRKFSRAETNTDVLNRLLLYSDPVISSMHQPPRRKRSLDKNVIQLLEPSLYVNVSSATEENEDSHSDVSSN